MEKRLARLEALIRLFTSEQVQCCTTQGNISLLLLVDWGVSWLGSVPVAKWMAPSLPSPLSFSLSGVHVYIWYRESSSGCIMRKGPGSMSKVTEMLTTCLKLLWDIHHVLLQKKNRIFNLFLTLHLLNTRKTNVIYDSVWSSNSYLAITLILRDEIGVNVIMWIVDVCGILLQLLYYLRGSHFFKVQCTGIWHLSDFLCLLFSSVKAPGQCVCPIYCTIGISFLVFRLFHSKD